LENPKSLGERAFSDSLLGYITLMDTFMMTTFGITGLVVLLNVWMKRLQRHGRDKSLNKLDMIGVWLYPVLYVGGGVLMYVLHSD